MVDTDTTSDQAHEAASPVEVNRGSRRGLAETLTQLPADPWWPTRTPLEFARAAPRGGRQGRVPPGPRGLPVIGAVASIGRDVFGYWPKAASRYGDVYRVPVPLFDYLTVINHPELVARFMSTNSDNYTLGGLTGNFEPAMGRPVALLEGEEWRRRRKVLNPAFGHRRLRELSPTITQTMIAEFERWDGLAATGEQVDLEQELSLVFMSALLRTMFSADISAEDIAAWRDDYKTLGKWNVSLMAGLVAPRWLPLPYQRAGRRAKERGDTMIDALIAERRANPRDQADLLAVLLDARFEDDTGYSDAELRDEIRTLVAAGFDTLVAAVSWTLALLASHPEHRATQLAEVEVLGGAVPTADDLGRLTWTRACFDEAQRLQGAPLLPRQAIADDEIDGYRIPAGSMVAFSMYGIQRDPRWWPDPDRYDPSRFADPTQVDARPRYAFLPFGAGPRHCVGSALAYMEAQLFLALFAQRFEIELMPGWTPSPSMALGFGVGIKGGLPAHLRRRA